jgi:hypothetical protein
MGAIVPDLLLFFDKYQWLMNNSGATKYLISIAKSEFIHHEVTESGLLKGKL